MGLTKTTNILDLQFEAEDYIKSLPRVRAYWRLFWYLTRTGRGGSMSNDFLNTGWYLNGIPSEYAAYFNHCRKVEELS